MFPSSHSSPVSFIPLPQLRTQLVHPSLVALELLLPLEFPGPAEPPSHCYVPLLLTTPSPQNYITQDPEHPSPSTVFPSSHC